MCRDLAEVLNLKENYYHLGFVHDPVNSVWGRVADLEPVTFSSDGWLSDNSKPGAVHLEWFYSVADSHYKNWVVNFQNPENYFICEYL